MNAPITTSEYMLWAYRLLLGREPENSDALERAPELSRQEILEKFLTSAEFLKYREIPLWMARGHNKWFLTELPNSVRFWVCASDEHVSRSVVGGNYEPAETAFVRRHVKKGMNALDIGANIGWFTVNMAFLVGPAGRVDAFEPRDDLAFHLGRTLLENRLTNVTIHRCALGATEGPGRVSFGKDDHNPGGTHLEFGSTAHWNVSQETVVRRLASAVWTPVDFIKIDVEGAEKLVLDGAGPILDRDRPIILTEVNHQCLQRTSQISAADYVHYLETLGYVIAHILPDGRCGERAAADNIEAAGGVLNLGCFPEEEYSVVRSAVAKGVLAS